MIRLEPGREILFYPSFFCDQTINHFTEKFLLDTKNLFISSIALKPGDTSTIIAGDSFGKDLVEKLLFRFVRNNPLFETKGGIQRVCP